MGRVQYPASGSIDSNAWSRYLYIRLLVGVLAKENLIGENNEYQLRKHMHHLSDGTHV